jgi:cellulose synthase (UDP-forming)
MFGFSEMSRGVGGQILLEQYSMAKFFTYLKTMVIPFFPKKGKIFKVTPKGEEGRAPARTLIIPQFLVLMLSFTAMLWALVELLLDLRSDSFIVSVNCFWALYNSGLALAIIHFDYKKLFQRRSAFRIPDTVLASYRPLGETAPREERLAVVDNITEEGIAMVALDQIPVGKEFAIDLMLSKPYLRLSCRAIRERSMSASQYQISHIGLRFTDISQQARDIISRYLHASAVTKFMKDYVLGYKTYLERRFGGKRQFSERAARSLAYLPVIVREELGIQSYGVIKDISDTGLLILSQESRAPGSEIILDVVVGNDRISLTGYVVRSIPRPDDIFPEYLIGVHIREETREKAQSLIRIANQIGDLIFE